MMIVKNKSLKRIARSDKIFEDHQSKLEIELQKVIASGYGALCSETSLFYLRLVSRGVNSHCFLKLRFCYLVLLLFSLI